MGSNNWRKSWRGSRKARKPPNPVRLQQRGEREMANHLLQDLRCLAEYHGVKPAGMRRVLRNLNRAIGKLWQEGKQS